MLSTQSCFVELLCISPVSPCLPLLIFTIISSKDCVVRYGAGKVSSGANVYGAPLPEDVEENGKEEEVGEFGFHTLVRPILASVVTCQTQPLSYQSCRHTILSKLSLNWSLKFSTFTCTADLNLHAPILLLLLLHVGLYGHSAVVLTLVGLSAGPHPYAEVFCFISRLDQGPALWRPQADSRPRCGS